MYLSISDVTTERHWPICTAKQQSGRKEIRKTEYPCGHEDTLIPVPEDSTFTAALGKQKTVTSA